MGTTAHYGKGGSGGRGGRITQTIAVKPNTTYTITVGAGGIGSSSTSRSGSAGGSSSAFGITAQGGGGGASGSSSSHEDNGTSYGNGAYGGKGGSKGSTGETGKDGWVHISFGQHDESVFANVVKFTTAGTYTFTAPASLATLRVIIAGAGGGGGCDSLGLNEYAGGDGELVITDVSVTPKKSYTIIVGAGGSSTAGVFGQYTGSAGGSSSAFGVTAQGGSSSGLYSGGSAGGAGAGHSGSDGFIKIEW